MVIFGLNSASVLAQVNFGANSASILGIFLAVAGAALYFLRTVRPELSRDQDIFFAAVGLLCGFILVFQGWRLDPILQFGQLLLVGSTVFFAVESIRLRAIATQQAKRNTPIVDEEREVSRKYEYRGYKAEVDAQLEPLPYDDYEDDYPRARIPGSRSRSSRDPYYDSETPRRSDRRNGSERPQEDRTPSRRSSSQGTRPQKSEQDDWDNSSREVNEFDNSTREERKPSRRSNNSTSREQVRDDVTSRPRKRRPSKDSTIRDRQYQDDEVISTEYVDYKPMDLSENEPDNSTNFDDV